MPVRLFVGNLPYSATEAALREHFSSVGSLSYIYLPVDRESGKPRGFAFIEFKERAEAEQAIRQFNNQLFMGRPLAVNEARERDDRSQAPSPRTSLASGPSAEPPGSPDRTGRTLGPDAPPRKSRKRPGGRDTRSERGPKQPIRERPGGRFFGDDDDDGEIDDLSGENFASRVSDPDDDFATENQE